MKVPIHYLLIFRARTDFNHLMYHLKDQKAAQHPKGFEPTTFRLAGQRTTPQRAALYLMLYSPMFLSHDGSEDGVEDGDLDGRKFLTRRMMNLKKDNRNVWARRQMGERQLVE